MNKVIDSVERKRIIENSNIDFSQQRWCFEVAELLNVSYTAAYHWIERNMPDIFNDAYKVDDLIDIRKSIIENCDIDFSDSSWITKVANLFGVTPSNAYVYIRKYMPEFYENHCYNQQAIINERIEIVKNCNIDFSKNGWGKKLSYLFCLSPSATHTWVKRHMPDFYNEKCCKRTKKTVVKGS
jgi:hypothetical protein